MNFDEAMTAHAAWKMKLTAYLQSPNGSLKVADIQVDNICVLGQWIYGEGLKYSHLPEYATLKTEHARFHRAAADVVKRADAGQDTSAEIMLGAKSEFAVASTNVVIAIKTMKRKSEAAA